MDISADSLLPTVLVVGASFSGLTAARKLAKEGLVSIIVVEPKNYFEYTPGIHHVLGGNADITSMSVQISSMIPHNVTFLKGSVERIEHRTAFVTTYSDKQEIIFDYCILATGATYPSPVRSKTFFDIRRRRLELVEKRQEISRANTIVCVGAGLVGVEFASEIIDHYPNKNVYLLDLMSDVLSTLPTRAQNLARDWCTQKGIELRLGEKSTIEGTKIIFEKSEEVINADLILWCCGQKAVVNYASHELESNHMGFQVKDTLQSNSDNSVFICGDCGDGSSIGALKTAYVAEEQGLVAAKNILNIVKNKKLIKYPSNLYWTENCPTVVIVSLGKSNAILCFNNIILSSQIFLYFKHFIQFTKIKQLQFSWWCEWIWYFGEITTAWFHYLLSFCF